MKHYFHFRPTLAMACIIGAVFAAPAFSDDDMKRHGGGMSMGQPSAAPDAPAHAPAAQATSPQSTASHGAHASPGDMAARMEDAATKMREQATSPRF